MPAKRAGPIMRMTPPRYTRRIAQWPNAGAGRTVCSTRTDIDTALAAGQRVTVADGVTIGTTGDPDLIVPSGADIRGASYGGATFNINLSLTSVSGVVLEGFRMGTKASVLGNVTTSCQFRWITCLGGGNTDYGIRLQAPDDCHLYGCIARRYRVYGFSLEGIAHHPCSVRQCRWEQIGRTPPVLDGVTECGLNMNGAGTISGVEGLGSAWAEIRLDEFGPGPAGVLVVENARLEGRIGIEMFTADQMQLRRCRITPSLYGIVKHPSPPLVPGDLGSSTLEDITIMGGVWGIDLEGVINPTVQRIVARDQTAACIREASGSAVLLDRASCDLFPAPGGVDVLIVP